MILFGRKRKPSPPLFDPTGLVPVIRVSICTGEQVAGFKDPVTGKFREAALIRDRAGLREFLEQYGVEEKDLKREY